MWNTKGDFFAECQGYFTLHIDFYITFMLKPASHSAKHLFSVHRRKKIIQVTNIMTESK